MGFFKKAFNTINKIASNPIVKSVGGTALPANTGDQGHDGIAILEAMLQRQARAQWRGSYRKHIKKVATHPVVKEIGGEILKMTTMWRWYYYYTSLEDRAGDEDNAKYLKFKIWRAFQESQRNCVKEPTTATAEGPTLL